MRNSQRCGALPSDRFDVARELFDQITTDDEFVEFLTLPGYEKLD